MNHATPKSVLEQISTCWPMIHNPVQFVMRYARAIQKYVFAIVRDPHDAEEVAQDFLVQVFDKGFCPENVSRGRFRFYLKSAVRYVAISHLRKRRSAELSEEMTQLRWRIDAVKNFTRNEKEKMLMAHRTTSLTGKEEEGPPRELTFDELF